MGLYKKYRLYFKLDRQWDTYAGAEMALVGGYTESVESCAFSQDGHTLSSAVQGKSIRLWKTDACEPLAIFPCIGFVMGCSFRALGKKLTAGDSGGNVYILEWIGRKGNRLLSRRQRKGSTSWCAARPASESIW